MLLLMQMLNLPHGITVPEFQHYCMHSFGVAPNRKSVYQDLYAIEKYLPLVILRPKYGKTVYKYSFSVGGESDGRFRAADYFLHVRRDIRHGVDVSVPVY